MINDTVAFVFGGDDGEQVEVAPHALASCVDAFEALFAIVGSLKGYPGRLELKIVAVRQGSVEIHFRPRYFLATDASHVQAKADGWDKLDKLTSIGASTLQIVVGVIALSALTTSSPTGKVHGKVEMEVGAEILKDGRTLDAVSHLMQEAIKTGASSVTIRIPDAPNAMLYGSALPPAGIIASAPSKPFTNNMPSKQIQGKIGLLNRPSIPVELYGKTYEARLAVFQFGDETYTAVVLWASQSPIPVAGMGQVDVQGATLPSTELVPKGPVTPSFRNADMIIVVTKASTWI